MRKNTRKRLRKYIFKFASELTFKECFSKIMGLKDKVIDDIFLTVLNRVCFFHFLNSLWINIKNISKIAVIFFLLIQIMYPFS